LHLSELNVNIMSVFILTINVKKSFFNSFILCHAFIFNIKQFFDVFYYKNVGINVNHSSILMIFCVIYYVYLFGRGADMHMAQLMPLSLNVSCFSKVQIGFTFLVTSSPR